MKANGLSRVKKGEIQGNFQGKQKANKGPLDTLMIVSKRRRTKKKLRAPVVERRELRNVWVSFPTMRTVDEGRLLREIKAEGVGESEVVEGQGGLLTHRKVRRIRVRETQLGKLSEHVEGFWKVWCGNRRESGRPCDGYIEEG